MHLLLFFGSGEDVTLFYYEWVQALWTKFMFRDPAKYRFEVPTGSRRINSTLFIRRSFEVSMAFNTVTISTIAGLLLGPLTWFIISARELGQQCGISGLIICIFKYRICQGCAIICVMQKKSTYLINNRRSQSGEYKIRIWWHITAIYLPQENSKTTQ